MSNFKSGFISVIGRPNVGKSTFINYVLGRKISIISPKPQTTRNQIRAIYTTDTEQMIFVDTPGIHKPHHELGDFMNTQALSTLKEVDVVLLVVDATQDFGKGDQFVSEQLTKIETPVILVLNKIDLVKDKGRLMESVLQFQESHAFADIFYISAKNGDNVEKLLEKIAEFLEEGPMYYPKEQVSDYPEVFIISEMIREKVLLLTKEEVPHSVAVVVEQMKDDEDNANLVHIHATIYVERTSQKKIIIGNKGDLIKKIGTLARKEIVMILGRKVYLELWVKVEEDWRNKKGQLRRLGYSLDQFR